MGSDRWKKASLAIDAIIRGLEHDQVAFQYDESASLEPFMGLASLLSGGTPCAAVLTGTSSSLLLEQPPRQRATTAAYL
jgi:hypothetical protein